MVKREYYLNQILPYVDKPFVKILTGIRRSGKSTLLEMIKDNLIEKGIKKENIIFIQLDSFAYEYLKSGKDLYEVIQSKLTKKRCYVFIDEIQEIDNWEKYINYLMVDFDVDIYITGSSSKLMPSEISTDLTGRYINIPVYPLSYKEFIEFKKANNEFIEGKNYFQDYIMFGGYPAISMGNYDIEQTYSIIKNFYNATLQADIIKRYHIRKIDLFEKVTKYLFENAGKTFSSNSIIKYLKSDNRSLDYETIYNYINYLKEAYLIYPCPRYDIKGKEVLKTREKYYIADSTLKYANFGYDGTSLASILENIVFMELKIRGYTIYTGKNDTKEIDFIGEKNGEKIFIQVCRNLPNNSSREIENLLNLKNHYHKYVLSNDPLDVGNVNGIKILYLPDFLLKEEW